MSFLFFDTETTGLIDKRKVLDDPSQPHLVQLAALLTDDFGHEVATLDLTIKPDGWEIPAGAAAVHGITTETALARGVPLVAAAFAFFHMRGVADAIVAHNIAFDRQIMDICEHRMPIRTYPPWPQRAYCTMDLSAYVVNLPPTSAMLAKGMSCPKSPSLSEAFKHLTGKELIGAHDALHDVRACRDVFFCLRNMGAICLP